ncbi:hypothetical protein PHLGIDRAFT_130807 [Phlebiopsis gigantea 11061_1 CR5-6]|uniref:Uncharacterized protein n=1 Tax=Phlebiopsis gigantea (strain 11061_1 CR5-6) TaxID=745531 RepID=A0A0C3NCR5_PHLG1|nr:hypothetical protein PHLGIDRAFT_130807 [Phlebiopsis gigantea 11061_1 CR5-6]
MGFFKRLFSIGSKKSRRNQHARHDEPVDANGRIVPAPEPWQQADRDATRLLRSSSAHFSVVSKVDYTNMPPLPHPINSVATTPAATPAKSEASVQRRGTYTVKVLERKLESRTEFPNANPPIPHDDEHDNLDDSPLAKRANSRHVPFTPRDESRLLRLRQDPSVVSLLNMYDDKGRISSTAFSNTPDTSAAEEELPGRQPVKRSGSTLRQLLGEPSSEDREEAAEGDISWAERYLGEYAASTHSLASTAPVETPKDIDTHSPHDPSTKPFLPNFTFSSDLSHDISASYPIISSMEVELSGETEPDINSPIVEEPEPEENKTPKRAAEVFGFLTERRKSVLERQRSQLQRGSAAAPSKDVIPPLPSLTVPQASPNPDISDTSILTTFAQIHTATVTKLTPVPNPLSRSTDTSNLLSNTHAHPLQERSFSPTNVQTPQLTGESPFSTASGSSSKIPRGPRPAPHTTATPPTDKHAEPHRHKNSTHKHARRDATASARPRAPRHAHDPHTPQRTRNPKRRVCSQSSSACSDGENSMCRGGRRHARNKENSPPALPLRTLFDVRHPNLVRGDPPSPASSSELSPVAKEMMLSVRKQRMRAREEVRGSARHARRASVGR